ncbi:TrlF family AAA-like ATPase [uncultured Croceitalea sp.]|uniref:TrlF family AAA-like ATPase n=1 Tax=uncultured Croceitalea sp. TaxID=1798908 RepID=UPI0033064C6F
MTSINNPIGSIWHRWDPHIHIPGTLKNDYKDGTSLDDFLQKVNASNPPIKALGITDYNVLDSYERILPIFKNGGLPNVKLLFPNIELRFSVNAGKGSPINVHLLVSPDDADHIEKTKRFLRDLKFEYDGEDYGCVNDELIRLGEAFDNSSSDREHLLKVGVEQFKVTPKDLSKAFKNHQWARKNIMVGVAAGQNDGTAQLQESGLTALREELQRISHLVFSGRTGDRDYWCGKGVDSEKEIRNKYKSLKPCLHGSDAHDLESVGKPNLDRYCWLRGDLKFETLRQICFEPERRVFIGKEVSENGFPSHTIEKVTVNNGTWLKNPEISVNSGLVAIIGARGSGKTALVEMIAAGSGSVDQSHAKRSFLERAKDLLQDTTSTVAWGNSETTTFPVDISQLPLESEEPRVRYLSQQFVDHLCSSDGLADELINAIENVIFDAHSVDERLGARTFEELRSTKTESIKRSIDKYQKLLQDIGDNISIQDDLARNVEDLKRKRANEFANIERMKADRKKLIPSDNKELLKKLDKVREATEAKSQKIATIEKKELKLKGLKEEANQFEDGTAKPYLEDLKTNYEEAKLTEEQWANFNITYKGDVGILLQEELSETSKELKNLKGPGIGEPLETLDKAKAKPYLQSYNNLPSNTYTLLLKEQNRLEALIGVDSARRKKYTELSNKIAKAETALKLRDKEVQNAEAAPSKIKGLLTQREDTYQLLIGQIEKEEELLSQLYSPLQERLNSQKGTLSKLTFSVNRIVDIEQWAESGERLIDRSRVGQFRGVGTLTGIIKEALENIWKNGSSEEIAKAMSEFRTTYGQAFWNHAFEDARKTRETKKHWYGQISSWLYGIDHVKVNYGLKYEGVDVQQLSPGTRGIVLLLLYLSIDIDDDRPLIIDQPEENLDPKSIFEELVEKFKEAKKRRQIIIVTHNANLVVNTDADQVIVASRGKHKKGALPDIEYMSGGLENPEIRKAVCDILEGGKQAFEERSKRLRINI